MTTVLLVRHAETALNDPNDEKLRGFSDVPIDREGVEKTKQVGKWLAASGYPIRNVIYSPLQRAAMTASIISEATSAKIRPNRELLPWDLGSYSEKSLKEVLPKMKKLQQFVDIKAPEGESYSEFFARWSDGLNKMLDYAEAHPDETLVGVVHSRNLLALDTILNNGEIGSVPAKGGPPPSSVTLLHKDGDNWKQEVVFKI